MPRAVLLLPALALALLAAPAPASACGGFFCTNVPVDQSAEPENYPAMRIADDALVFNIFGGDNYQTLVSDEANRLGGCAFISEYAGPTARLSASDPTLAELLRDHAYLTRVYTRISPEEMTVDPVFKFNPALPKVSNFHNLSKARRIWDCDANTNRTATLAEVAIDRVGGGWGGVALLVGLGALVLAGLGFGLGRLGRRRSGE